MLIVDKDWEEMQTTHLCLRKTRGISTNCHRTELGQWTVGYSGQLGWRRTIAALLDTQRWDLNVASSVSVNNSSRQTVYSYL